MADDYYKTCAFPKTMGEPKKKKKKQNGYKDKALRYCYYTGTPNAERHEIFGGPNRQTSIDHGFQVDVHPVIHRALQYSTTQWAIIENQKWRKHFQRLYEEEAINSGMKPSEARKLWMMLIGKNYLGD